MALQAVELLYATTPSLDVVGIARRVAQLRAVETEARAFDTGTDGLILHQDSKVRSGDGEVAVQTALRLTTAAPGPSHYRDHIAHSACGQAEAIVNRASHVCLVAEMLAQGLPAFRRLGLFHAVLQAAIEISMPLGLAFKHSQQIVAPADYMAARDEAPIRRPGSLNIRLHDPLESGQGEKVMDTRGLHEIGLRDLQCRFSDLEPKEVRQVLVERALEISDPGFGAESTQTSDVRKAGGPWSFRPGEAILMPARPVIEVHLERRQASAARSAA